MLDQLNSARGFTLLALTAAFVALLVAESARAGCGGVAQENPKKNVSLGRAPIAIGDSPMLLALGDLADEGYRANARGCRQYPEGLALIRDLRSHDKLPRLVVIALGSNGVITKDDIHSALDLVGKKRILGLVTPREEGGGSGHDAELVRKEAHKHKHRTVLLDWVEYSAGHSSWFQPDGLHLTFDGADALARLFKKPLKLLPKPHHHHHHGNQRPERSAVRALTAAISAGGRRVPS
jgi:lysophospholipase L1-like esterase